MASLKAQVSQGRANERLRRGQVGTIVEVLGPDVFEVEFSDDDGRTYATLALKSDQFIVLHYHAAAKG